MSAFPAYSGIRTIQKRCFCFRDNNTPTEMACAKFDIKAQIFLIFLQDSPL